jgi:hypothetical protein
MCVAVSFIIDGHHKMAAAAELNLPCYNMAFVALDAYDSLKFNTPEQITKERVERNERVHEILMSVFTRKASKQPVLIDQV